jgi:hypothetical protein
MPQLAGSEAGEGGKGSAVAALLQRLRFALAAIS